MLIILTLGLRIEIPLESSAHIKSRTNFWYPDTEPKVDLFGSILKAAGGVLMKFGKLSVFFLVLLDFGSDHGECLTINDVW